MASRADAARSVRASSALPPGLSEGEWRRWAELFWRTQRGVVVTWGGMNAEREGRPRRERQGEWLGSEGLFLRRGKEVICSCCGCLPPPPSAFRWYSPSGAERSLKRLAQAQWLPSPLGGAEAVSEGDDGFTLDHLNGENQAGYLICAPLLESSLDPLGEERCSCFLLLQVPPSHRPCQGC